MADNDNPFVHPMDEYMQHLKAKVERLEERNSELEAQLQSTREFWDETTDDYHLALDRALSAEGVVSQLQRDIEALEAEVESMRKALEAACWGRA